MPPVDIKIRVLEPRDQSFLREALYVALWDAPGEPRRPRSVLDNPRIAALIADWGQPGDVGFVAEHTPDGEPIGAVWIRAYPEPPIGAEYLEAAVPHLGIAVVERFQLQGIGTELLERALAAASQRYAAVALSVHPRNPARHLYERHGFRLLGPSRAGYLIMQRDLAPDLLAP